MRYFVCLSVLIVLMMQKASAIPMATLQQTCETDYRACLEQLPSAFEKVEADSIDWYSLQLYRLDALFNTVQMQELSSALDELEPMETLPPRLTLNIYIYRAKLGAYFEHPIDITHYSDKASELLGLLREGSNDPYVIIDYANFQIYLQQYQLGIDTLLPLERKFREHRNTKVKSMIYTNLGNLYSKNGELEKSLSSFELAYANAMLDSNVNNKMMTQYNVARAYQILDKLEEAKVRFFDALEDARKQKDPLYTSLCNFRIGQILVGLEQHEAAKEYFDKVEVWMLSEPQKATLKSLKNAQNAPRLSQK